MLHVIERWKSWIIGKCIIWYMYGYCYYLILQGKDPEEEYKQQCEQHNKIMQKELEKSEYGREILRLLEE